MSEIFYFRIRIPSELRVALKRSEFRKSLNTGNLQIASTRATLLLERYHKTIATIAHMKRTLSHENIDQLVLEYFESLLGRFYLGSCSDEQFQNEEVIKQWEQGLDKVKRTISAKKVSDESVHYIPNVLRRLELEKSDDALINNKFEQAIHSAAAFYLGLGVLRVKGELNILEESIYKEHEKYKSRARANSNTTVVNDEQKPQTESTTASINPAKFSDVVDAYLKHCRSAKGKNAPTPTTLNDYAAKLKAYQIILNDACFHTLTKQSVVDCKKLTYNLPKNINKLQWQKTHTSLRELICDENHTYARIEITTISKYLAQLKKLCQFAFENNYCHSNPSDSIKFEYTKEVQNEREPFTTQELSLIFNGHIYQSDRTTARYKSKPFQFWLPLLGAYTGARLNEICSLYIEDIQQDESTGCHFFSINRAHADKKLKTKGSERKVPIAKPLFHAGLLDYISWLEKQGAKRLFPELQYSEKEGYGKEPSRWFNKLEANGSGYNKGYLAILGIKTPESPKQSKNFHCFRHTFIHNLKNNPDIEITRVADLVGHDKGDLQTQSYGGREYAISVKLDTMSRLDYKIDLSHVHWKNFERLMN